MSEFGNTFPSENLHKLSITYGGEHCLMPDVNGELLAHINRHFSHFFEPCNPTKDSVSLAHSSCGAARPPVILPAFNKEPRIGLYQLYWPAGFSRSAKMYAILQRKDLILSGASEYAWLKIDWKLSDEKPSNPAIALPMTIVKRAILTEDAVLCELRDLRYRFSNKLLWSSSPKPSELTLREFVITLTTRLLGASDGFDSKILDNYNLPHDINIDLDSLWRYDTPIAHLLDAAIGGLYGVSYELLYRHLAFDDKSAPLDFAKLSGISTPKRPLVIRYPNIVNGRVRHDLAYMSYYLGGYNYSANEVSCSHPYELSNASASNLLGQAIYEAESYYSLLGTVFRRFAAYHPSFFADCDAFVLDFSGSGGGVSISNIPSQTFPLQRHYYWLKDTKPTCEPMDVIRIQLLENMPVCSDAAALHLSNLPSEDCPCDSVRQVLVRDTAGIARTKIQNSQRFAPAQSMGFARHLACSDTGEMDVYELVSIGQGCCPPPGSSDYQECCEPWFTRFENLASVTEKAVGAEIAYGETIGQLKGTGETAYLIYKAYLSSSDVANGCAIDLSGIHSFEARNSRTSGTSPCTPSFSQCAIDYALLKMSGRLPVASGPPCGADPASLWYEDLSAAGTGDDYHERTIKADPGSCAISKKVYNFTSVRTTVLTKGADYVVLKHWCDPTSSSSSSGVDDCCAQFTDYDMRCVGGVLQRWSRQYEVCWNGDCLETRILHYWQPTGETVGCCDCGSGVSSSSSSGPTEPPGCVDGVTVVLPGTGYQSGGPLWDIVSASYDMATGNWSVTATANANAGTAPSCGAYYVCDEVFNAASNPVVTNCTLGNSTTQNGPFCQGDTVTITGTSTPPTAANCSTWEIAIKSWATPFLSIYFDCAACPDPI